MAQLKDFFVTIDEKPFRAKQLYEWLWSKNEHDFDKMSNLSKELREKLNANFIINPIQVDKFQKSTDGTIKNAIKLFDGNIVESVLIPSKSRTTACVSAQVGCSLDCNFCATSRLDRVRNLTAAEIVDQVALIDQQSKEYFDRPLSNIVFMGMGEPLLNYNNVVGAVRIITSPTGMGMSPKRITLSTSGIPKMIMKLADENLKINLALSLHSAQENVRNDIMPFSSKFPLTEVMEALEYWYEVTQSRITLEYIIWKGINDNFQAIDALVKFCKKVPSKVNLIEYNSIDDSRFQPGNYQINQMYLTELEKNNIIVNVRRSRGKDIDAACGQLANKNMKNA